MLNRDFCQHLQSVHAKHSFLKVSGWAVRSSSAASREPGGAKCNSNVIRISVHLSQLHRAMHPRGVLRIVGCSANAVAPHVVPESLGQGPPSFSLFLPCPAPPPAPLSAISAKSGHVFGPSSGSFDSLDPWIYEEKYRFN